MQTDWAVIPVAGKGSRMYPVTRAVPKELLPLGRKPALQWIVEELVGCGFRHLVFVTAAGKEPIERFLIDSDFQATVNKLLPASGTAGPSECEFYFVEQKQPLGLGDAIACTAQTVGNRSFAVALGDCVLGRQRRSNVLERMAAHQTAMDYRLALAFEPVPDHQVSRFGIANPGSSGEVFQLTDVVEKPSIESAPSNLAIAGRYLLCPEIFEALTTTKRGVGNEIQLTDAIRQLIGQGMPAAGFVLGADERRYDVGDFESYFQAFAEFAAVSHTPPK